LFRHLRARGCERVRTLTGTAAGDEVVDLD
jgi:hypothetical protein